MRPTDELEQLRGEYGRLNREYNALKTDWKQLRGKMTALKEQMSGIGSRINQLRMEMPAPMVTDHAIVRYLERYKGLDVNETVAEILAHPEVVVEQNAAVTVKAAQALSSAEPTGNEKATKITRRTI